MDLVADGILQAKKIVREIEKTYDKNVNDPIMCNPIKDVPNGYKVLYSPDKKFREDTTEISIKCDTQDGWGKKKNYTRNHFTCNIDGTVKFEGCKKKQCNVISHIGNRGNISISMRNKEEMNKLIQGISKHMKLCDNLENINDKCSLGCKFGYEPSNLQEHIKQGGVTCTDNARVIEKAPLKCNKKT